MKIKEGFVVREVAGTYLALATGELSKVYNGSITLNSSAKFIFDNMQTNTTKEEVVKKTTNKKSTNTKKTTKKSTKQ